MSISKAAVGFIAGACIAAGGTYVATRSDAPAVTAQQADQLVSSAPAAVEQSEAIVAEEPAVEPVPAPVAPASRAMATRTPARPRETGREEPSRSSAPIVEAPAPADAPRPTAPPAVVSVEPPRIIDNQASRAVAPPGPLFDELVVAADSVIGLEIESALSTERAKIEDPVTARVTRDVRVGNRVAIPAGSRVNGEVTVVERGGRLKERARLGVRFTSIVLADGTRVPIETETIYREGDSPVNESAAKIGGGAIGGAILGGILGGAKGAAIGTAVGGGAGGAAVAMGGRNAATLPAGTPVTVRVQDPVVVTVER